MNLYYTFLPQNCHYLEKMDLEDCVLITDNTLTYLAAGCPRLEQLVRFLRLTSMCLFVTIHYYNYDG